MEENIVNAFECVAKMYEETSFLLKDFSEFFYSKNFISLTSNSMGSTMISKDLNQPRYWLPRYAAMFFKPKSQKENSQTRR